MTAHPRSQSVAGSRALVMTCECPRRRSESANHLAALGARRRTRPYQQVRLGDLEGVPLIEGLHLLGPALLVPTNHFNSHDCPLALGGRLARPLDTEGKATRRHSLENA